MSEDELDRIASNTFIREMLKRQTELMHRSNEIMDRQNQLMERVIDLLEQHKKVG